jgi:hypothetical protein
MNIPEVQEGMKKLGFSSPYLGQTLGSRAPDTMAAKPEAAGLQVVPTVH